MRVLATLLSILAGCAIEPDYDHGNEIAVLGGKADGVAARKTWTFLLYGAADNNLAADILRDVNELESAGSTADVNFIAFLDQPTGASVHYLVKDADLTALHSPTASWGTRDSGDVNTLIDFAEWGLANYPAERYAVVIGGHGGGSPRTIAPDDSTGNSIATQSLESAIHAITYMNSKIEVFGADACLMQTIELTYQLKYQARYIVASENTEPGSGWDYVAIGNQLAASPDSWGRDLAHSMVDHFETFYGGTRQGGTLAALSSNELLRPPSDGTHNASDQLKNLVRVLLPYASTPAGRTELGTYAASVRRVYGSGDDYADLVDLLTLMSSSASPEVRTAAASTRTAVQRLISSSWIDPALADRVHGLSIYFPHYTNAASVDAYFTHYQFAKETGWTDLVRRIHLL